MGFFSGLFGAAVKTVLTPIAVAKDALNIAVGEKPDATKKHAEDIIDDLKEALEDL